VLSGAGWSAAEIEDLVSSGVVAASG
jgi:hypothetical protein